MSGKNYVTATVGKKLSFNYDYKQVFHHEFSAPKTMSCDLIVKTFRDAKYAHLQVLGLEVLKFLKEFCFATREQIEANLKIKKVDMSCLDELMDWYLSLRIINYFTFAKFDIGEVPEDAFCIFCLDHGARGILTHYSNSDHWNWFSSDNFRSTELVIKYLSTTEVYLQTLKTKRDELKFFEPLYDVNIGKRSIRFSAGFRIMNGFTPRDFILESVRNYDLPIGWQKKVDQQIAPFVEHHWKKYYETLPVFIFLVEDEAQALEVAEIYYRRTESNQFRIITDQEVKKGFNKAVFLKYVPATEESPNATMVPVTASAFRSEKSA